MSPTAVFSASRMTFPWPWAILWFSALLIQEVPAGLTPRGRKVWTGVRWALPSP